MQHFINVWDICILELFSRSRPKDNCEYSPDWIITSRVQGKSIDTRPSNNRDTIVQGLRLTETILGMHYCLNRFAKVVAIDSR